jgi:hypothetical protein
MANFPQMITGKHHCDPGVVLHESKYALVAYNHE